MNTLTFAQKLRLPLLLSLACLITITGFVAWLLRQAHVEERENDLADNVISLVRECADLAQHGALTRHSAQKEAIKRIKGLRFGKDGQSFGEQANGLARVVAAFRPDAGDHSPGSGLTHHPVSTEIAGAEVA
jgi:hypothetical protein